MDNLVIFPKNGDFARTAAIVGSKSANSNTNVVKLLNYYTVKIPQSGGNLPPILVGLIR